MPVQITCPKCKKSLQATAGTKVACPGCKTTLQVPCSSNDGVGNSKADIRAEAAGPFARCGPATSRAEFDRAFQVPGLQEVALCTRDKAGSKVVCPSCKTQLQVPRKRTTDLNMPPAVEKQPVSTQTAVPQAVAKSSPIQFKCPKCRRGLGPRVKERERSLTVLPVERRCKCRESGQRTWKYRERNSNHRLLPPLELRPLPEKDGHPASERSGFSPSVQLERSPAPLESSWRSCSIGIRVQPKTRRRIQRRSPRERNNRPRMPCQRNEETPKKRRQHGWKTCLAKRRSDQVAEQPKEKGLAKNDPVGDPSLTKPNEKAPDIARKGDPKEEPKIDVANKEDDPKKEQPKVEVAKKEDPKEQPKVEVAKKEDPKKEKNEPQTDALTEDYLPSRPGMKALYKILSFQTGNGQASFLEKEISDDGKITTFRMKGTSPDSLVREKQPRRA